MVKSATLTGLCIILRAASMQREAGCVFCDIVHGDTKAHIVYQDDMVTVFMDIHPVNPGHLLVIPNTHAVSIREVPDDICGRMFVVGRDLDNALRSSALRCDAVSMYLADGRAAGQTIFHAHLHVIPRYPGDSSGLRLHAVTPKSSSAEELHEQAVQLADAIQDVRP
jgi:histidine triad (HIT) family protein